MGDGSKRVVAAIIVRDGRVLLQQRAEGGTFPMLWESPGGKVEPGETDAEAMCRELQEELDLLPGHVVVQTPRVTAGTYEDDTQPPSMVEVVMYLVNLQPAVEPVPMLNQSLGWFTPSEMEGLELVPANGASLGEVAMACRGELPHQQMPRPGRRTPPPKPHRQKRRHADPPPPTIAVATGEFAHTHWDGTHPANIPPPSGPPTRWNLVNAVHVGSNGYALFWQRRPE